MGKEILHVGELGNGKLVKNAMAMLGAVQHMAIVEIGAWLGHNGRESDETDISTLTGATLGLLALLLGFSFSLALSRFDARQSLVLEEANAIGSTANFALMLPEPAQKPILYLLRTYTAVRVGLGYGT
jgi:hypothetical protein